MRFVLPEILIQKSETPEEFHPISFFTTIPNPFSEASGLQQSFGVAISSHAVCISRYSKKGSNAFVCVYTFLNVLKRNSSSAILAPRLRSWGEWRLFQVLDRFVCCSQLRQFWRLCWLSIDFISHYICSRLGSIVSVLLCALSQLFT